MTEAYLFIGQINCLFVHCLSATAITILSGVVITSTIEAIVQNDVTVLIAVIITIIATRVVVVDGLLRVIQLDYGVCELPIELERLVADSVELVLGFAAPFAHFF